MKKIPLRRCLATNEMCPKGDLLRIVKTPSGEIKIDLTGRENGRGAYLKRDATALALAKRKRLLDRALECKVPDEVYAQLDTLL